MDIAQLSMMANQTSLGDQVGISLLKKSMDSFTESSTNITEMLASAAVDPNLGGSIDSYV